jgi:hypothetical protein
MDKATRAVQPRGERLWFTTTKDIKQRVKAIAKARRWSVSKTVHLAVVMGLNTLEGEQTGIE